MLNSRFEFYAITDQTSAKGRSDIEIARGLIGGGATCLQYRAKKVPLREQWEMAFQLSELCRESGVSFIVNDRLDLAMDCGAAGVHLGQDDIPIQAARRIAGKKFIIGRSTHSLEQALIAQDEGADYIGFGPVYLTQTKENNVNPLGVKALADVMQKLTIPVIAIGGIKLHHLGELACAGAEHIAVVTAITGAADVRHETQAFVVQWRAAKKTPAFG